MNIGVLSVYLGLEQNRHCHCFWRSNGGVEYKVEAGIGRGLKGWSDAGA